MALSIILHIFSPLIAFSWFYLLGNKRKTKIPNTTITPHTLYPIGNKYKYTSRAYHKSYSRNRDTWKTWFLCRKQGHFHVILKWWKSFSLHLGKTCRSLLPLKFGSLIYIYISIYSYIYIIYICKYVYRYIFLLSLLSFPIRISSLEIKCHFKKGAQNVSHSPFLMSPFPFLEF
jgi:hypothetical protein